MRERKKLLAWGGQAVLGFLPAKHQERLYETIGLNPTRATLWSAVLETAVASPFALLFYINMVAGSTGVLGGQVPTWAGLLAFAAAAAFSGWPRSSRRETPWGACRSFFSTSA
jgi:hypothetical protein